MEEVVVEALEIHTVLTLVEHMGSQGSHNKIRK
jgi:hypothetical protein